MRSSSATTSWASSTSWCSTASRVRPKAMLTRSSPPSALASRLASSSRYSARATSGIVYPFSAEATADVVLGLFLVRVGEDPLGRPHLHQVPGLAGLVEVEEGGDVAGPRRLLHVVSDDDDRVAALQLADQVLDRQRRHRIERRAGLVHQQDVGLDRDRAGDAEPLLLTAGEAAAGLVEPVGDLVPEVGAAQAALDHRLLLRPAHLLRVEVEA